MRLNVDLKGPLFKGDLRLKMIPHLMQGMRVMQLTHKAFILRQLNRAKLRNTGNLAASFQLSDIRTQASKTSIRMDGIVGTPVFYALPLETGTRPFFPGKRVIEGPLRKWVERKLRVPSTESLKVSWKIAWGFLKGTEKNPKGGIKERRYMEKAFKASLTSLRKIQTQAVRKALEAIGGDASRT